MTSTGHSESVQPPSCFPSIGRPFPYPDSPDQLLTPSEFASQERPASVSEEMTKLQVAQSAVSFSDVARDRDRGTPNLIRQPIGFAFRQRLGKRVHIPRQRHCFLPNNQLSIALGSRHVTLSPLSPLSPLPYREQRLAKLDRLAVGDQAAYDFATGVRLDLVHQLHGLDDADDLALFHVISGQNKRRGPR